jgi:hypothetical protein
VPISPKGVVAGVATAALLILGIVATTTALAGGSAHDSNGQALRLASQPVAATKLASRARHTITYRAGWRGQTVTPAGLWSTPVDPGLYEVTFNAMLWDQTAQGPANFVCGVLDLETFGTDDQTIYVAASAPYLGATNGGPPAAVSGAATVRVREGSTPGAVCFPDTGTFQFFKPLNVSFTRIDSREKRVASPLALGRQLRSGTNPFGTTD